MCAHVCVRAQIKNLIAIRYRLRGLGSLGHLLSGYDVKRKYQLRIIAILRPV